MTRIFATNFWRQQDPVLSMVYPPPTSTFSRAGSAYRHFPVGDETRLEEVGSDVLRCSWQRNPDTGLWIQGAHLEPGRTNKVVWNTEIDNAAWTKNGCFISDTEITLLTGSTSLYDVLHENGGNGSHDIYEIHYLPSGWITQSAYIYPINRDKVRLTYGSQGGAYFNLATLDFISAPSPYGHVEKLNGGWYRCQHTFDHVGGVTWCSIWVLDDDYNSFFPGQDWDSFGVWGVQLEMGEYASSLIVTGGNTVSRTTDSDYQVAAPLPAARQGWLSTKVYITPHTNSAEIPLLTLSDGGSAADRIRLVINTSKKLEVQSTCTGGDGGLVEAGSVMDGRTEGHDVYLTWRPGELCLALDGVFGASDHIVSIPDNLDQLNIHPSGAIIGDVQMGDKFSRVPWRFLAAA